MFRSAVRYLRFKPEDGQHVVARGRVSVYEPKGEYQIVCEVIEPKGLGALQLAFEQLKKKLDAEGLFAAARKRPLPTLPRRIGIVTSLDGAAVRDIIKVLQQRHAAVPLLIRPCRVQGDGAAAEVAQALRQIVRAKGVDVVIVGRGGGSLEDLRAFNDEIVARAIAASPVPVISAVGHEVDFTIADFVADVRAATPSNAAELVVARHDQFCQRIDHLDHRMHALLRHRIQQRRASVHLLATRRGLVSVRTRVGMRGRHVAELLHDLRGAVTRHICSANAARCTTCACGWKRSISGAASRVFARDWWQPMDNWRRGCRRRVIARMDGCGRSRAASKISARSRCSRAATPSAGPPTAARSCATRRPSPPARPSTSASSAARWSAR